MSEPKAIRAVLFKDGHAWCGQCLEYDIGAQADSLDELHSRLRVAIDAERDESIARNGEAFKGIDAAPQYYFDMWDRRSGLFTPTVDGDDSEVELALCA